MTGPHPFLSDEWVAAALELRDRHGTASSPTVNVKLNLVITDVPFGGGTVQAHMDTTTGALDLDFGHVDTADATATMDYATARALIVDADPQAGMQAFMAGKIKVQGNLTKAMALSSDPHDPERIRRIQAITS